MISDSWNVDLCASASLAWLDFCREMSGNRVEAQEHIIDREI